MALGSLCSVKLGTVRSDRMSVQWKALLAVAVSGLWEGCSYSRGSGLSSRTTCVCVSSLVLSGQCFKFCKRRPLFGTWRGSTLTLGWKQIFEPFSLHLLSRCLLLHVPGDDLYHPSIHSRLATNLVTLDSLTQYSKHITLTTGFAHFNCFLCV